MKVIKHTVNEHGYYSVLIKDRDVQVWVDVSVDNDGEITSEWNQYIFCNANVNDMQVKRYQENCNNYVQCTELAEQYLLDMYGLERMTQHSESTQKDNDVIKNYEITVKSDSGVDTIKTAATTLQSAIKQVCDFLCAPESAVIKTKRI